MAAHHWAANVRDLPDPVGYEDFASRPDLTADRILERHRTERFPFEVHMFPLPKSGGLRALSWLDPFDDLTLRVFVGRLTPELKQACQGSTVMSYPLEVTGAGWRTRDHRNADRERRDRGVALLNKPACRALGTLDVADYYHSIDMAILQGELVKRGAQPGAVGALIAGLGALPGVGGTPGLPIGFEGSGPLGNAFLLDADSIAVTHRVGLLRYTDDSWLFLKDPSGWGSAVEEWVEALSRLGLEPQPKKVQLYTKENDDPWSVIRNGTLDSLTEGSTRYASVDEALDLLVGNVQSVLPDDTVRRFCLSVLRIARDPRGVEILVGHRELVQDLPKAAGDYLVAIARGEATQRAIDPDWLIEEIVTPGAPSQLAGRLQLCRVAAQLHLGRDAGKRLSDLATAGGERRQVPLRTWAAVAWARSEDWKPSRGGEAARYEGVLSVRRAHVLGFRHRAGSRASQKVLDQLARIEPDLCPSVTYAAAA